MLWVFAILNALAAGNAIYNRRALRCYHWGEMAWLVLIIGGCAVIRTEGSERHFSTEETAGLLLILTAINTYACGRIVGRRRPLAKDGRVDWDKITSQGD